MRFRKEWGLISYLQKNGQSMIIFIEFLIKKIKGKFNGILDPKVYLEKI
jgi:hypothetical protein